MNFYSNGKLLITGEYAILDGAKALALPTKFGQDLEIKTVKNSKNTLFWKSFDLDNKSWFTCEFDLVTLKFFNETDYKTANVLQFILKKSRELNPKFLLINESIQVKTNLTFNRNWGLGTSSTLINNIANWANVDAYVLQLATFGGSAYDIACAKNDTSIIYQLKKEKPMVKVVDFNPNFKNQLYFIYLNKKKNSRNAIKNYRKIQDCKKELIQDISLITNQIINSNTIIDFEKLLEEHEKIISKTIKITPIKQQLFKDYFGAIKSLGAWEGDFILATGNANTSKYFKNKGFKIVIPFKEMILSNNFNKKPAQIIK